MRQSLKTLVGLLAVLVSGAGARAITADAPSAHYEVIPERNVFGLKPADRPAITNQFPTLPKLILTGITTILGNKRVLLKEQPPGARPGEAVKEQSLILTEGQREGNVEVLAIDEHAGSVRVNNSGTFMTLTFDKDGPKLPSTPAPAAAPPAAAIPSALPGVFPAVNATNPTVTNPYLYGPPGIGYPNPRTRTLPTRLPRASATGAEPSPATPTTTPLSGADGTVPSPTAAAASSPGQTPLTSEEQAILHQVQQALTSQNTISPAVPNTTAPAQQAAPEASPGLSLPATRPPATTAPGATPPGQWPYLLPQ